LNFLSAIKILSITFEFLSKIFKIRLTKLYGLKLKDITNFNVIMKLNNELNELMKLKIFVINFIMELPNYIIMI